MCDFYRCSECEIIVNIKDCELYYNFRCRKYLKYTLCINCRKLKKEKIFKQD